jgi:hypothetical protein
MERIWIGDGSDSKPSLPVRRSGGGGRFFRVRHVPNGANSGLNDCPKRVILSEVVLAPGATISRKTAHHPQFGQPCELRAHIALRQHRPLDCFRLKEERVVVEHDPLSHDQPGRSSKKPVSDLSKIRHKP